MISIWVLLQATTVFHSSCSLHEKCYITYPQKWGNDQKKKKKAKGFGNFKIIASLYHDYTINNLYAYFLFCFTLAQFRFNN